MPRNVASGGAHGRRRGRVVVHTVAAFFIGLCAWGTARVADANATGPACDDAVAKRSEERVTDVRVSLSNVLPMSRDILRGVDGFTFFNKANGQLAVDLIFKDIRNLDVPKALSDTIAYENKSPSEFLKDPRSTIRDLWRVDEATVAAADLAYDVEDTVHPDLTSTGRLDPARVEQRLPNYTVVKSFADTYTGFKAVVLESREGLRRGSDAHRIYAIAGTQVFVNTDFRDWASGLTLARTQFVSDAALLLIKDAADYARDPDNGGEVFVTGQSQGAVISQGLGYLLQAYLSSTTAPHRLVHVVSWGGHRRLGSDRPHDRHSTAGQGARLSAGFRTALVANGPRSPEGDAGLEHAGVGVG